MAIFGKRDSRVVPGKRGERWDPFDVDSVASWTHYAESDPDLKGLPKNSIPQSDSRAGLWDGLKTMGKVGVAFAAGAAILAAIGAASGQLEHACPQCLGTGRSSSSLTSILSECPKCGGTGKIASA